MFATTTECPETLDGDAMLAGFRAAQGLIATDYSRKDQAYWSGHLNGRTGAAEPAITPEQIQLAGAVIAKAMGVGRLNGDVARSHPGGQGVAGIYPIGFFGRVRHGLYFADSSHSTPHN